MSRPLTMADRLRETADLLDIVDQLVGIKVAILDKDLSTAWHKGIGDGEMQRDLRADADRVEREGLS